LAVLAPLQRLVRVADLALAGQEHQHVAEPILSRDLVHAPPTMAESRPAKPRLGHHRLARPSGAIAHLHRIPAPFHAEDRRTVEMRRKRSVSIVAEVTITFRSRRCGSSA
jgi:hypothetical protein